MRYTVGLREANHYLAKHIKAVEEHREVIITRRGRLVGDYVGDRRRSALDPQRTL